MLLYLDNCCFNRPFDNQKQAKVRLETEAKLHIQDEILNDKYQLVWSYILEYENSKNPFEDRRSSIIGWKNIAAINIGVSESIIAYAEKIHNIGIKPKDALHIACAVASKADFFLTTDKKLLNVNIEEIKIRNPLEFVGEEE
jgi:predicted nucleic acid-binding protein